MAPFFIVIALCVESGSAPARMSTPYLSVGLESVSINKAVL